MSLNVVLLDSDENFIEFLDPDLLEIKETNEEKGIRRCNFSYPITEINHAKQIFKMGNKVWVSGGRSVLEDCLYVIPDAVKFNLFQDNMVDFEGEDVLLELNYAPFFKQTDLTAENGFNIQTVGGEKKVTVNRKALEFWFGKYFNIGLMQDCLSDHLSQIAPTGTMTLMSLLRYIEEETSNVFVTRYEKDPQKNVIHRYLDFLNPNNYTEDWSLKVEFNNIVEDTEYSIQDEIIVSENPNDVVPVPTFNREELDFNNLTLQVLMNNDILVQFPLIDVGLSGDAEIYTFLLNYQNGILTVNIDGKKVTSQVAATSQIESASISETSIESFNPQKNVIIPNGAVFEIVDTYTNKVIYSQRINPVLGNVQPEVLELTHNTKDIDFEINEADTFNAIAPVLKVSDSTDSNALSKKDYDTIISRWVNLHVNKGDLVPMIVQKTHVQGRLWGDVVSSLGGMPVNVSNNYWAKPLKQNNQLDESNQDNNKWEVIRGTAYWPAPFSKKRGEIFVADDTDTGIKYQRVTGKSDVENVISFPKIGQVETSDEDPYAIFNDVCMKLKDKRNPSVNVKANVANFHNRFDNNYKVYDTVFIKIPGVSTLVTAKIIKTVKNPKDVLDNTVELGSYSVSSKKVQKGTEIIGSNLELVYPNSAQLPFTLLDSDGNPMPKKLVTFVVSKIEESGTSFVKSYNKYTGTGGIVTYPVGFKPGNYTIDCTFGGDLIYSSSTTTVSVNVSGIIVSANSSKESASKKTTTQKKETVQTYYDSYGRSPDGKYIMAVGLPSAGGEVSKYGYVHWEAVFYNKCPHCGRNTLYWGYRFGSSFRGRREGGSYEGTIYCDHCDADYSIFGKEHVYSKNKYLSTYKNPVRSSHERAQTLKNGRMPYDVVTKEVESENIVSVKPRIEVTRGSYTTTQSGKLSPSVRSQALSVVGDSEGVAAAKKIVLWVANNIKYEDRHNFYQTPDVTLKRKLGNGCTISDLICHMCDAAGVMETVDVRYVHVHKPGTGHVFLRINGVFADACKKEAPWGGYLTNYGSLDSATITQYPILPFERDY